MLHPVSAVDPELTGPRHSCKRGMNDVIGCQESQKLLFRTQILLVLKYHHRNVCACMRARATVCVRACARLYASICVCLCALCGVCVRTL